MWLACRERKLTSVECLPPSLSTLFLRQGLSPTLELSHSPGLAAQENPEILHSGSCFILFYMGAGNPQLGSGVCVTSILTTGPSPPTLSIISSFVSKGVRENPHKPK